MVTGASTADCAVILVDARKGVLTPDAPAHAASSSLLGIRHVVLAVNKMDLVDYSEARFGEIEAEYRGVRRSGSACPTSRCIPMSALAGDNVVEPSDDTPWYDGPTLLEYLETVEVDDERLEAAPFRMPVQWVNRPSSDFRGFAGTIAGGSVRPGDEIRVLPSRHAQHASSASSPMTAISTRRSPARRSRSRWPTRSTSAAAT